MATATVNKERLFDSSADNAIPHRFRWTNQQYHEMADMQWFRDHRVELLSGEVYEKYPDGPPYPRPWRWTRTQYEIMNELGWFHGKRVELVGGEIFDMTAMNPPHWISVGLVRDALQKVFGAGYIVVAQSPMAMTGESAPEPDVAVVRGMWRDFQEGLPEQAVLVVEVSDTTLTYDRAHKSSLYAASHVEDYWIVNVNSRRLEVFRQRVLDDTQPFAFGYAEKTVLNENQSISPLAAPQASIKVADLLP